MYKLNINYEGFDRLLRKTAFSVQQLLTYRAAPTVNFVPGIIYVNRWFLTLKFSVWKCLPCTTAQGTRQGEPEQGRGYGGGDKMNRWERFEDKMLQMER